MFVGLSYGGTLGESSYSVCEPHRKDFTVVGLEEPEPKPLPEGLPL